MLKVYAFIILLFFFFETGYDCNQFKEDEMIKHLDKSSMIVSCILSNTF